MFQITRERLCALLCLLLVAGASAADDRAADERVDLLMQRYHELGQFDGSVLVAERDTIVIAHGYGLANREWNVPNQPDTRFRVGSISKAFTSALIMQLVAEGALTLDTTVGSVLPYYREDLGARITIEHLLTHRDGIPNYTRSPDFWRSYDNGLPYTTRAFIERYCSDDPEFEPGSDYRYGNAGYSILGAIVEELTGSTFEAALDERLLAPLGMRDSGVGRAGRLLARRASGYQQSLRGFEPASPVYKPLFAAGAMISTAEDLRRFDRALYGDAVLDDAGKRTVFSERPGAVAGTFAYGWNVGEIELPNGQGTTRYHATNGEINGFNAVLIRLVDRRQLIVLLNNSGETNLFDMITGIIDVLYDAEPPDPAPRIRDRFYAKLRDESLVEAIDFYREQRAAAPNDFLFFPYPLRILALQMLRDGDTEAAIAMYRLNLETHEYDARSHEGLAEAYLRTGDRDAAARNLARALELDPGNGYARALLERIEDRSAN